MRKLSTLQSAFAILVSLGVLLPSAQAQITLGTSPYTQDFDGIGSGLPTGWTVRTSASATVLGTTQTLATGATAWSSTTGSFRNSASSDSPATSADNTATQGSNTDRSIGLRQSGTFGDPGAAYVMQIANTTGLSSFDLSFKLQSLDVSITKETFWIVDYGTGASPTSFTTVTTSPSTPKTGGSAFNSQTITVNFGSALNNLTGPVWIRITTRVATLGSGSRPTTGLDDVSLSWATSGTPDLSTTALSSFGNQCINAGPYGPNTFTISGTDLTTADVTVAALSGFEYSATGGAPYFNSLTLTQGGGTYGPVTINVRFNPTAAVSYNGNIVVGGGGASNTNRAAVGSGVNTAPAVTTGAASAITTTSATVAGTLNTTGICGTVTAYGIVYSTTAGFTPVSGTRVASTNLTGTNFSSNLTGIAPCTVYYMRAYAIRASDTTYASQSTFTTSALAAPVASAGTAITASGFTANWATSPGAVDYRLDVSEYATFGTGIFGASTTEVFDAATVGGGAAGSYSTRPWTGVDGVSWTCYKCRTDQVVFSGNDAIALQDAAGAYLESGSIAGGVESISFDVKQVFSGSGGVVTVKVLSGVGFATSTTIGTISYNATASAFSQSFAAITGPIKIRLENSTSTRAAIDNLFFARVSTFVPDFVTGYENLTVAGLSQAVVGLSPATTYYYRVRAVGPLCTSVNSNVITVTTSAIPVYYSQGSGNVTDNIWDAVAVGTPGPANFTSASNMVIQSGHVVTNTADVDVKDLDVQIGGELVLNTATTLSAFGTAVDLDGTITAAYGSTLALVGTSAVALGTTGTPTLSNLTISTANGTALTGNLNLNATLGITDGAFDASNGSVTLTSDATNTGNLGQVGATASYIGSITVQRYIPAGATNWRLLGSPVDGVSVGDWNDDFITAGFPGSDYPTFDSPVGSNILWPSVREYDETATGVANDGLNGVADMSDLLTAGKGFAAWCGTSLNTTSAFTVDVTGAPNIASGPIDLEVSYTAGAGLAEDGWNLVSNPLPSAIDFTEVTLGANTYDGYYIYNPIDGTTEVWDEFMQTSPSGTILNGAIASSQGFWLKTTAANPTNSSVDEAAKVPGNGGPLFGGLQVPAFPIIRLNISSNVNAFSDNALVVFDLGAPEFEPIDAPKMFFSDASAPMIASLASTGESMAINKYGAITEGLSIPVKVQSYVAGTFTITAGISGNPFACMWLEDTQTGTLTALTDGAQYSFQLAAGASTTARFMIHSTVAVPLTLEPGFCGGTGSATVDLGANVADITWTTPTGSVVLEQLGATGENTFSTTVAGNYSVHISTNAVCGEIVQDLYIDIDATSVVAEFTAPATSVVNEAVAFTNTSTDHGTFFWNFGDNTTSTEVNPTHVYAEPGTYTVSLEVTADDCAIIITHDVVVSVSTGIATIATSGLNVWSNTQGIVMEHSFTEGTVKVEVLDATGRLHIQRQVPATPGRTVIATDALNTGIWFVRVTNGDRVQSFRVPLVR